MKTSRRSLATFALSSLLVFAACKKENSNNGNDSDIGTETTSHADDQSLVSVETADITNEATLAVESNIAFSGKASFAMPEICDALVSFDTAGSMKKITITYDSATCSGARIRSGVIVLSMPKGMYWKNAGAALTIAYQNLKIKCVHDKKTITLNGSHIIANTNGGSLINLPTIGTITHTISGSISIRFGDSTERNWQMAQKRVFSYNNGLVITITGNHTEGNVSNIAAWGTNRFGHAFKTLITQPLIIRQDCAFRITSGTVMHEGFGTATATYGLDGAGNPTSCPNGNYYCKVVWTGLAGQTKSAIISY